MFEQSLKYLISIHNSLGVLGVDTTVLQQQQRPDLTRLLQLQAGAAPGGLQLPPGFPGLGPPPSGAAPPPPLGPGLLAGLPPSSSAAALVHMMAGARLPGPPHPADLYADKEKELAKLGAAPGPMSGQSDDRNVSVSRYQGDVTMCEHCAVLQRTSLSPSREHRAKSPDRRSPDPKKMKKDEVWRRQ